MKKFIDPKFEVEAFEIEDILTTSAETEFPIDPDQGEII